MKNKEVQDFRSFKKLNESENIEDLKYFSKEIEDIILKYFPRSTVRVSPKEFLGNTHISLLFTVGTKEDWSHKIIDNDPMFSSALITDLTEERMKFKVARGFNILVKPEDSWMAYGRVRMKRKNKTGNKEQILRHIDKLFSDYLDLARANVDNLTDGHKWVEKYI